MTRTGLVTLQNAWYARHQRWNSRVFTVTCLYVVVFVLLAWLSDARPQLKIGITPWNPQAGLTLAFLLLYGSRYLPATVVAAYLSETFVRATPVAPLLILAGALWIGLAYGALAAVLRLWRLSSPIQTTVDAARMAALSSIGTFIVAAGYVGIFVIAGDVLPAAASGGIARYWVGDLNGVLTLTPLLIYVAKSPEKLRQLQPARWEILAQFAAVVLTLWIIFLLPAANQLRLFYLLFVPMIWIALRWRWPGAMLATLVIQLGLLIVAEARIPTARFIDLQFLMLTISLTALLLGAVVAERAEVLRRVAMQEIEQRALLATAPDAVLNVDTAGEIRVANAAARRMFGSQPDSQQMSHLATMLPGLQLEPPEGRAVLDGHHADGQLFPAEVAWAQLDPPTNGGFLVTVRDVSDRQHAEEQLRERDAALGRAMRFAVAGELASSLAHELNQPITALVSYVRSAEILATRTSGEDALLQTTLGKAAREALRASEVLRRLRDFYQSGTLKLDKVHIPTLCHAVVNAFQDRLRRTETSLALSIDESIPTLVCDGTQIEIVLHNLLGNALDAVAQMPKSQRQIKLHAACIESIITLRVDDSGKGIPKEVAEKLFEPFVTSKTDGMGLGLAISRSLIVARGGELSAAVSVELGGTSFTARLPIEIPSELSLV
jgi:two-component system sensor kinase FixL